MCDKRNANATAELPPGHELHRNVADVADVADTDGDRGLIPLHHANVEHRPPAEDFETTEELFNGLRDKLLADLDAREHRTSGSGKPREPERDDGERKNYCPQCQSPLGATTSKCWRCIASAKNAAAHEYRRQTDSA